MGSAYVRYASICSAVDWNSWNNSKRWQLQQACFKVRQEARVDAQLCMPADLFIDTPGQRFELFQLFQSTALQIEAYRTYAEPIERFHFRARHSGRQLRHPDEAGAQASQRLKQIALLGT